MIVILAILLFVAVFLPYISYATTGSAAVAAGALVVVAAASILTACLVFGSWDGEPLSLAVADTQSNQSEFEVSLSGPYEVVLAIERFEGRESPFGAFPRLSPVDVDWWVTLGESEIASGSSRDGRQGFFGGASLEGQIIGRFDAQEGLTYTLVYVTNELPAQFTDFNPRIRIWSDNRREPFHSRFFIFPALFWSGALAGAAGVMLLVWTFIRRSAARRSTETAG